MNRLGSQTKRVVRIEESYAINLCFEAKEELPQGAVVKLNTDGTVSKYAGTGSPFGVLSVGAKAGESATVATQFVADIVGVASEAIAVGDRVLFTDLVESAGRKLGKYKKATDMATGIALSKGEADKEFRVGVLRVFTKE